jgi:DNA polymerase-3 subunit epsilon
MRQLAADERYEEAASVRDRAAALATALDRRRRLDALRHVGRLVVETTDGHGAEIESGMLLRAWGECDVGRLPIPSIAAPETRARAVQGAPPARDEVDEMMCVVRWLEDRAPTLRILHAESGLALDIGQVPRFDPRRRPMRSGSRASALV